MSVSSELAFRAIVRGAQSAAAAHKQEHEAATIWLDRATQAELHHRSQSSSDLSEQNDVSGAELLRHRIAELTRTAGLAFPPPPPPGASPYRKHARGDHDHRRSDPSEAAAACADNVRPFLALIPSPDSQHVAGGYGAIEAGSYLGHGMGPSPHSPAEAAVGNPAATAAAPPEPWDEETFAQADEPRQHHQDYAIDAAPAAELTVFELADHPCRQLRYCKGFGHRWAPIETIGADWRSEEALTEARGMVQWGWVTGRDSDAAVLPTLRRLMRDTGRSVSAEPILSPTRPARASQHARHRKSSVLTGEGVAAGDEATARSRGCSGAGIGERPGTDLGERGVVQRRGSGRNPISDVGNQQRPSGAPAAAEAKAIGSDISPERLAVQEGTGIVVAPASIGFVSPEPSRTPSRDDRSAGFPHAAPSRRCGTVAVLRADDHSSHASSNRPSACAPEGGGRGAERSDASTAEPLAATGAQRNAAGAEEPMEFPALGHTRSWQRRRRGEAALPGATRLMRWRHGVSARPEPEAGHGRRVEGRPHPSSTVSPVGRPTRSIQEVGARTWGEQRGGVYMQMSDPRRPVHADDAGIAVAPGTRGWPAEPRAVVAERPDQSSSPAGEAASEAGSGHAMSGPFGSVAALQPLSDSAWLSQGSLLTPVAAALSDGASLGVAAALHRAPCPRSGPLAPANALRGQPALEGRAAPSRTHASPSPATPERRTGRPNQGLAPSSSDGAASARQRRRWWEQLQRNHGEAEPGDTLESVGLHDGREQGHWPATRGSVSGARPSTVPERLWLSSNESEDGSPLPRGGMGGDQGGGKWPTDGLETRGSQIDAIMGPQLRVKLRGANEVSQAEPRLRLDTDSEDEPGGKGEPEGGHGIGADVQSQQPSVPVGDAPTPLAPVPAPVTAPALLPALLPAPVPAPGGIDRCATSSMAATSTAAVANESATPDLAGAASTRLSSAMASALPSPGKQGSEEQGVSLPRGEGSGSVMSGVSGGRPMLANRASRASRAVFPRMMSSRSAQSLQGSTATVGSGGGGGIGLAAGTRCSPSRAETAPSTSRSGPEGTLSLSQTRGDDTAPLAGKQSKPNQASEIYVAVETKVVLRVWDGGWDSWG